MAKDARKEIRGATCENAHWLRLNSPGRDRGAQTRRIPSFRSCGKSAENKGETGRAARRSAQRRKRHKSCSWCAWKFNNEKKRRGACCSSAVESLDERRPHHVRT